MAFTATLPQYTNMNQRTATTASTSSLHEKEKILGRFGNGSLMRHQFPSTIVDEDFSADSSSLISRDPRSLKEKMITQSSMVRVPRCNDSYDLATFLRTSGPPSSYLPSIKSEHPEKPTLASRLFKRGHKRRQGDAPELFDEGGLLLPDLTSYTNMVEQKISLAGKRYLAVLTPYQQRTKRSQDFDIEKPGLDDLKIASLSDDHLAEDITIANRYDKWYCDEGRTSPVSPLSSHRSSMDLDAKEVPPTYKPTHGQNAVTAQTAHTAPADIQPSSPIANAYVSELADHPGHTTSELDMPPVKPRSIIRKPVTPMPDLVLPKEDFPVRLPRLDRDDIKHPSPRRFHSHPVLQRSSDVVAGALQARSDTESPATPPAKSPLRLRRDNRIVERPAEPEITSKTAPVIDLSERMPSIIPSVTTECIGPLSRPAEIVPAQRALHPASRREREERIRARKLRDRPQSIVRNTIDTLVSGSPDSPRRLRKPRTHHSLEQDKTRKRRAVLRSSEEVDGSQIRDLAPAAEITSAKQDEEPMTPDLSQMPAPLCTKSPTDKAESSVQTSPTHTNDDFIENKVCLHSMVLVAEEMPLPKTKSPFRPAKIVVAKERVYTPRPRSASMPKPSSMRRSRTSMTLPSRVLTPEMPQEESETPPLPSPPPNRALPPTPPASGSEKMRKKSKIPSPPARQDIASMPKTRQHLTSPSHSSSCSSECGWKVVAEQFEKKASLLEAALWAMLKTNGASNAPLPSLVMHEDASSSGPTSPQRNRSEANHAASNSNGSALDMFLSTRRSSKSDLLSQA